ncbi:MAG: hypothetical protein ACK4VN_16275 [Bacteroidales bacterium]
MRFSTLISFLLPILLFSSCNFFGVRSGDERIARVGNVYLYRSDLEGIVAPGTSASDSTVIAKRYIDNWIRQQVYLKEALNHVNPNQREFQRKIEDYRTSLIIFSHESDLVRARLDTVITDELLREYYERHSEEFRLRDHIVQVNYIKLPLDAPDINTVRRLVRSSNEEDLQALEEYCINNAATYFLDQDSWFVFNDILRDMPINPSNPETFLRNNSFVERTDEYYRYFLFIRDFRLEGSPSPLTFQSQNIRTIILNHRRQELINQFRQDVYRQAVMNGSFEIY